MPYVQRVNSINLPMVIYYFPSFSGVSFNFDNIGEFFCDSRFVGLKYTSNDFFTLERVKAKYEKVIVYNGVDEMFLSGLIMGADGGIGSAYNIMAEKFIQMRKHFKSNNIEHAQKIQQEVNEVIHALIKVGVMPGEKEILNMMGMDFGECRKPFRQLGADDKQLLEEVCRMNGIL